VDDLKELMRAFTQTTEGLERTHGALQTEVARLKAELAEVNARLRRSRALAALGEMAAGIAHEIRNPLGAIQLNVQMLQEDVAGVPAQAQLCEKIGRAVETLDAIVRDVLLFARDMSIRPTPTSARALVEHAVASSEGVIASSGTELALDVGDDAACDLRADTGLVAQAIGNVLRNAIEASADAPDAPRITVTARRQRVRRPGGGRGQRIVIGVTDRGTGIPPEVVERMFNPFFTTRQTGTGLGLAIVHRIIDAHGGHVAVSNAPTGGACVELCLPPRPPSQTRAPAGSPSVSRQPIPAEVGS
jgi:signal transduction histidine kinase